jgi:hypothetical protein
VEERLLYTGGGGHSGNAWTGNSTLGKYSGPSGKSERVWLSGGPASAAREGSSMANKVERLADPRAGRAESSGPSHRTAAGDKCGESRKPQEI